MPKKRTLQPFYGKPEQRHEADISMVRQRMLQAGASHAEISEAIKYGEAVLQKMQDARRDLRAKNGYRNRKRFPEGMVHGRMPSRRHVVVGPAGRRVQTWS